MNRESSSNCIESVKARLHALLEARSDPSKVASAIIDACSSQSSLAALSISSRGINSLSRNSLYKYADLVITDYVIPEGYKNSGESGFRYLDWLRGEVKNAGKQYIGTRTKLARENRFEQRLSALSKEIDMLQRHSLAISKAYLHLMVSIKGLHRLDTLDELTRHKLINMINDHDRLYGELFEEIGTVRPMNVEML